MLRSVDRWIANGKGVSGQVGYELGVPTPETKGIDGRICPEN